MQVILMENVHNVGNLGDVVKVKNGFARNFLIPQGKAKRATAENVKLLEEKRADLEKAQAEKLEAARSLATRLEGMTIQVTQKAGVDGRLFGSVGNVDIVEALKKQGIAIEKGTVRLPAGPLKQVGDHQLTIALHSDALAHITVSVLGETVQG
jgi:large subunit ribosomal protein L9